VNFGCNFREFLLSCELRIALGVRPWNSFRGRPMSTARHSQDSVFPRQGESRVWTHPKSPRDSRETYARLTSCTHCLAQLKPWVAMQKTKPHIQSGRPPMESPLRTSDESTPDFLLAVEFIPRPPNEHSASLTRQRISWGITDEIRDSNV
jgi:hypothetical protein